MYTLNCLNIAVVAATMFATTTTATASDVGLPIWDVPEIVIENDIPNIFCPEPSYHPITPVYNLGEGEIYNVEPLFEWFPEPDQPLFYPSVCGCEYPPFAPVMPDDYMLLGTDFAPFPLSAGYLTPDYPSFGDLCLCYGARYPCVDPRIIYN